jgi:tricorn protease
VDLSPDGTRLAVTARGEIFSVPAKPGVTIPITRGSGARESWARFSGDGKQIVYVTDATGEEELRAVDAWDRGEPKTIEPARSAGWHFAPAPSPGREMDRLRRPDAVAVRHARRRRRAQGDRPQQQGGDQRLHLERRRPLAGLHEGDGQRLHGGRGLRHEDRRRHHVVPRDDQRQLARLGSEGRWLYFVSERTTNPLLGNRDFDVVEAKNSKIYLAVLKKDRKDPMANLEGMPPDADDKDKDKDKEKEKDKKSDADAKKDDAKKDDDKKDDKKATPVEIDVDDLFLRVVELPGVPIGIYGGLAATEKTLFYMSQPVRGMVEEEGGDNNPTGTLMAYDLEKKESKTFTEGVSSYVLAREGKIAVSKKKGEIYVVDAGQPPSELGKSKVDLSDCVISLDPAKSGARSIRKPTASSATSTGTTGWAASTGRRCATSTRRCFRGSPRDPTCAISSAS